MKIFQNILYAESVVEAKYRQGIENDEFSQWKKHLENIGHIKKIGVCVIGMVLLGDMWQTITVK